MADRDLRHERVKPATLIKKESMPRTFIIFLKVLQSSLKLIWTNFLVVLGIGMNWLVEINEPVKVGNFEYLACHI